MDAAALIKSARAHAGLTQAELASRAATSQPAIAAYETGAKSPSVRTLNKLIRACGLSLQGELVTTPGATSALLELVRSHQSELRQAAQRRRIRNVRIFGSAARGDTHYTSDIDILVDYDAHALGIGNLAGFKQEAETILGRSVDVSTPAMLKDTLRDRVLAEAVPL